MDFPLIYARNKDRIFQLARRLLGDDDRAADATQEAFLRAFKARDSFRGESDPGTWLFRIAYNLCMSRLTDKKEWTEALPEDRPEVSALGPSAAAERGEASAAVRLALAAMEEEDRRILILRMEDELDYGELGSILGCAEDAARQRYCRARKRLREKLGPVLEEGK